MLKQSKGVKRREKRKGGSVLSLRGKCGKICVELKLQGCGGGKWYSTGSLERFLKPEQQNDSNDQTVLVKQISLSRV